MARYLQRLHLRLSIKLLISSIIVTALLLLISMAMIYSLLGANGNIEGFQTLNRTTAASAKLNAAMNSMFNNTQRIQNQGTQSVSDRIEYYAARRHLRAAQLELAVSNNANPDWRALDAQLNRMVSMLDQLDKTTESDPLKAQLLWSNTALDLSNATKAKADSFNTAVLDNVQHVRQTSQSQLTLVSIVLISLCLLAIVVSVLFGFLNNAVFVRPIQGIRNGLLRMAAGDLTQHLVVDNNDELGDMMHTFNRTVTDLSQLINELKQQTEFIESAALEVSAISQQQLTGSASQVQAMNNAVQLVEELRAVATVIDQHATEVATATRQAMSSANTGNASIKASLSGLRNIHGRVSEINKQIGTLSTSLGSVGGILKFMDDLVDESQLLSLNATIEASGVGVIGRRFAVVAAQLGQLFERTKSTTEEVQVIITNVARAMNRSLQVAEEGLREVELSASESQKTETTTQEVVFAISRAADLAGNILSSTQQQRATSQQVSNSIALISEVASANLSTSSQATVTADSLSSIASQLRRVAGNFVVG